MASTDPDQEYLVLGSYLPLRRFRATLKFLRRVKLVRAQLETANGLVGYAMRARPHKRQYWTLSVWQDEAALRAFVRENPHSEIMSAMVPYMGYTQFVRWQANGSAIPPNWDDALRRLTDDAAAS